MRRLGVVRISIFALAGLLGSVMPLSSQTRDDNWKRCTDSDPDLKIGGCTAVIQSGQETNENLSFAFLGRGIAYDRKGNYDRAIEDYDQAIRLNPSYADAFMNRGNSYSHNRNYDRALLDYDEAIRLNPSNANAFNNRGLSYGRKANYECAIQDFDEAIRLNPGKADAFMNRGVAYALNGNPDRAIQNYDQSIRLNPSYATAFYDRGVSYGRKGDYDRAIQDYDEAIRLNPSYAHAFAARGRINFQKGLFAAAQPDFTKAAELDTSDANAAIYLYLSRSRAGQDARGELIKNAGHLKLTEWPGPAVSLYLGKATPESILSAATNSDAKKDREQHCEAYFYLGEYALLGGKDAEAKRLFEKAIDTGATVDDEYPGAQAELKRLLASPVQTNH